MTSLFPGQVPYAKGKEPVPEGFTQEDVENVRQSKRVEMFMSEAMMSCPAKTVMAGGAGLAIGMVFSLMTTSMSYEDPLLRQHAGTAQRARDILRDTGKTMWTSGKGFGKVGAIYASFECVIESYRAKNDLYNSVGAGFMTGGALARASGPKAAFGGGLLFAAFSAAIDMFMRRETPEED
ncbi:mitochondrial import inner membrane translocase subunit TIM22 [Mycena alexandri]|uniref:Mitochondrial import inner membrane translocase subunit TIM22 n=1 Tax=Mycena alexandri TaxID=1745969 RepID=A0AAD6RZQ6_9AGAR|nr:mitochondrial import inner membrane translocase subunit TIM22 [Mycena alexandri]KAJ7024021.1 mitochondrial import inner membrane translocase subunit TIM22 [Mycena alexandri]